MSRFFIKYFKSIISICNHKFSRWIYHYFTAFHKILVHQTFCGFFSSVIYRKFYIFFKLPAIQSYYDHRAGIEEMVRAQQPIEEFLKGNYSRKKTYKEVRYANKNK